MFCRCFFFSSSSSTIYICICSSNFFVVVSTIGMIHVFSVLRVLQTSTLCRRTFIIMWIWSAYWCRLPRNTHTHYSYIAFYVDVVNANRWKRFIYSHIIFSYICWLWIMLVARRYQRLAGATMIGLLTMHPFTPILFNSGAHLWFFGNCANVADCWAVLSIEIAGIGTMRVCTSSNFCSQHSM